MKSPTEEAPAYWRITQRRKEIAIVTSDEAKEAVIRLCFFAGDGGFSTEAFAADGRILHHESWNIAIGFSPVRVTY